jgi:hypothetical protein
LELQSQKMAAKRSTSPPPTAASWQERKAQRGLCSVPVFYQ